MRSKAFKVGILCRLMIALVLALGLIPIGGVPAAAQNLDEYFVISQEVSFSKNEVYQGEVFYATVTTQATCTKDLPLPVSEVFVTGRVIARHEESGAELVLNSGYTVSINPFPVEKEGDVIQVSQLVPLQFPVGSSSGSYNVTGKVDLARAKAVLWFTITSSLPSSQSMGSVTYQLDSGNPPQPDPVEPAPQPDPVEPAPQPDPVEPAPQPDPVEPAPQPDPVEPAPQPIIPTTTPPKSTNWWLVGSIYTVDLALLATILWLIRQRKQQQ